MPSSDNIGHNRPLWIHAVIEKRYQFIMLQIFEREISSFSKTTVLQREPFLTMCYTINSSSLLVTNYIFYANNYFEQLPIVSISAFKR